MSYALGEVEALSRKAARGAGYAWGLAEEAGHAVRWLCARDLDGCAALARVLVACDAGAVAQLSGRGGAAPLCPLTLGTMLADHGPNAVQEEPDLGRVAEPLLILPFVAQVAEVARTRLTLAWSDGAATTDGVDLCLTGTAPTQTVHLRLSPAATMGETLPRRTRALPTPSDRETLERFAHRTYAPATEASRLRGAGADTSD